MVIFVFSHQTGSESYQLSEEIATKLSINKVMESELTTESAVSQALEDTEKIDNISYQPILAGLSLRKYAHVLLFASLGVAVFLNVKDTKHNLMIKGVLACVICFAYSCFDEIHQMFVPDRGATLKDVVIDAMGYVSTIAICLVINHLTNVMRGKMER